jgi:hypothetical protein
LVVGRWPHHCIDNGQPIDENPQTLSLSGLAILQQSTVCMAGFGLESVVMSIFFLGPLLFLAYGLLCLLAPEKHLAFNAWLNRHARRKWHEQRAYTTPHLRMQRRWSQQTPANLRRLRVTGIAFIVFALWVM